MSLPSESETNPQRGWRVLGTEPHFESPHLQVVTERIASPARPEGRPWTVVHRKPAVVVAPMTADHRLVLIRQERVAIREAIWEVPAGQVDELCDTGSFREVALRELREETGYELAEGGSLTFLGDFFSSAGFTDERAFLFLARPVRPSPGGAAHEQGEAIIDCREFSLPEVSAMVADGEIRDANTLSIFARLMARGEIVAGT